MWNRKLVCVHHSSSLELFLHLLEVEWLEGLSADVLIIGIHSLLRSLHEDDGIPRYEDFLVSHPQVCIPISPYRCSSEIKPSFAKPGIREIALSQEHTVTL